MTRNDDLLIMRLMQIEHWLATGVAEIGTAALPSFAAKANPRGAFALHSQSLEETCAATR